jgi:hypothetical protein
MCTAATVQANAVPPISEMNSKQLGLLHQLLDRDARFAVLINPGNPQIRSLLADVQAAAAATGQQLEIIAAATTHDISPAFSQAPRRLIREADMREFQAVMKSFAMRHLIPQPCNEISRVGMLVERVIVLDRP